MKKNIILYGFSIFSMFFGSGNLVFPLLVGVNNSTNWIAGFIGFFLTGIILPFLGLFVIKLYRGNYMKFFGETGVFAKNIISLFTLSLLGSFGVVPRCITVAHGGLEYLGTNIPLGLFSAVFCIICFIACLNDKLMFKILGKFLTPILLFFLILVISVGCFYSKGNIIDNNIWQESFSSGFFEGYFTMDLFAAFFFSSLIFKQIELSLQDQELKGKKINVVKAALAPSIFGATLLAFIYLGFVYLGSSYSTLVKDLDGELILPAIANHLLGKPGAWIIAIIIILSCLTTAVALSNIYSRYLQSLSFMKKEKHVKILFFTMFCSFFLSLIDFRGIAMVLGPLLEISYPGLIFLTIACIFTRDMQKFKQMMFYIITIWMIFMSR